MKKDRQDALAPHAGRLPFLFATPLPPHVQPPRHGTPPQACDRRAPSAVLRVRDAGARLAVDRFQAQQPHQPPHPVPTNPYSLARQVAHHLPAAVERILQVQLVDAPHQRQRLRALAHRSGKRPAARRHPIYNRRSASSVASVRVVT